MKTVKQFKSELTLEWQSLQLLESPIDRSEALKAYQIKYALYRKDRSWQNVLLEEGKLPAKESTI